MNSELSRGLLYSVQRPHDSVHSHSEVYPTSGLSNIYSHYLAKAVDMSSIGQDPLQVGQKCIRSQLFQYIVFPILTDTRNVSHKKFILD